jgi:hypothetical protein
MRGELASHGEAPPAAVPGGWYESVLGAADVTLHTRTALYAAAAEAGRLRHDSVGATHLLFGLIRAQNGMAARVLGGAGPAFPTILPAMQEMIAGGRDSRAGHGRDGGRAGGSRRGPGGSRLPPGGPREIALGPGARRALRLTVAEMRRLGHDRMETGHLLLGVLGVGDGATSRAMTALGLRPAGAREELLDVRRRLDGTGPATVPTGALRTEPWAMSPGSGQTFPTLPRLRLPRRPFLRGTAAGVLAAVGLVALAGCGAVDARRRGPVAPEATRPSRPRVWLPAGPLGHPLDAPRLGVTITGDVDPALGVYRGMPAVFGVVIEPVPDGQAARAGLAAGDVVTAVNGRPTPSWRELLAIVETRQPGEAVELRVARAADDPAHPEELVVTLVIGQP